MESSPLSHIDRVVIGESQLHRRREVGVESHVHRTIVEGEIWEGQLGSEAGDADLTSITDNKITGAPRPIAGLKEQGGLVNQEGAAGSSDIERVVVLPEVETLTGRCRRGSATAPIELERGSTGDAKRRWARKWGAIVPRGDLIAATGRVECKMGTWSPVSLETSTSVEARIRHGQRGRGSIGGLKEDFHRGTKWLKALHGPLGIEGDIVDRKILDIHASSLNRIKEWRATGYIGSESGGIVGACPDHGGEDALSTSELYVYIAVHV